MSVIVDPALANIDIQGGLLAFQEGCSSMGNPSSTLTVETGGTLDLFQSGGATNVYTKQFVINGNGVTTNLFLDGNDDFLSGAMTLNGICVFAGPSTSSPKAITA